MTTPPYPQRPTTRDPFTRAPVRPRALATKTAGQGTLWALVWGWVLPTAGIPAEMLPTVAAIATSFSTGATLALGNAIRNFRTANEDDYPAGTAGRFWLDLLGFLG